MLMEQRFHEILRAIEEKQTVTVQELTELLNTSESTIRRDLSILDKEGKLNKVHGGATAIGH
ncbi:MAG: DeoR family transcriptional regulator, partial [Acetivibrio ethanolgignens]